MTDAAKPEAETVLRLTNITKHFGPLVANHAISFDVKRGEVVALLGENGAGKTTLMNILFGHYVADEGTVEVFGKPLPSGEPHAALENGIGMVHQHFTLSENMSVLENIALGTQSLFSPRFNRSLALRRITELSNNFGLDVHPAALVANLSVGERQRVEILKALYRNAKVLILDEPTAVLTPLETEALFSTLQTLVAEGLSIIFISHKLNEVLEVSSRLLVLRAGRLVGEKLTAETDSAELATLMVGEEVAKPAIDPPELGTICFELLDVSIKDPRTRTSLKNISLTLIEGEITGIAGVSGNGQSALAALIAGTLAPETGRIRVRSEVMPSWSPRIALRHKIGRIPEDRHATGIIGDMTVAENVISERYSSLRFCKHGLLNWKAAREFAKKIIAEYDVKCPSPDVPVRLLSGGNMQKLILGRALDGNPAIILANQPTRGLDIGAVAYVHERLLEARKHGAAILLISEDLDEVITLADRIMVISKGRFSSPSPRGRRSLRELGELMAGHGIAQVSDVHAA